METIQGLHCMDGLRTAEQIQLLDLVDSLRAEGLSEFTALPQLIVCGDQSSGKSSLLEAISGVPFPRKDNLCTRFATEVILRRASESEIRVSLVPGKSRSPADQDRLWQFRHEVSSLEDFVTLFEQAKDAMGLLSIGGNAFTEDILRVEISGPNQPQLTIVDLPGLIHSHNKHQTEHDVALVTSLVAKYMANPRSIILAVVSAKNDFPNQIVLKRAREVDPQGLRTLGVITKPDQLVSGSDGEKIFLSLARNEQVEFDLGWHVVRNLDSGDQGQDQDRDTVETQFLAESNFRSLSATNLGIAHLRQRLSVVLFGQIRAELPQLMEDIEAGISSCRHGLEKLGPARVTLDDQKNFLVHLSDDFQSLCEAATKGDYEHKFFADQSLFDRRLSAMTANRGMEFEEEVRTEGAQWKIVASASKRKRHRTRTEAVEEVRELLKKSRGRELPGLPNPLIVGEVFREYSKPWEGLARQYIEDVWNATKGFLEQALRHLTDATVSDNLLRYLLDPAMDRRLTLAYSKLDELMAVHKEHPETRNHYFTDRYNVLQRKQSEAKTTQVLEEAFERRGELTEKDIPRLLEMLHQNAEADMDLVAAESTFNAMEAFYKVAMKLFIDNVPNLVVRAIIVSRLPSLFCPKSVFAMDPDLVKKIASETEDKRLQRQEITVKLKALEAGNDLCKQYALRVTSVLPILRRTKSSASMSTTSSLFSVKFAEETPKGEESDSDASN
ncbi:dynamin family protein [Halenospora varia]|nr:dynamin family protein [Halenospora varia]